MKTLKNSSKKIRLRELERIRGRTKENLDKLNYIRQHVNDKPANVNEYLFKALENKYKEKTDNEIKVEIMKNKERIKENSLSLVEILDFEKKQKELELKRLAEIEERNRRIERIKMQKLKIYEERRKMNQTLENEKEYLLTRFNELMSQKGKQKKTKEELMNQLFNEEYKSSTKYKTVSKNKSSIDVFKGNNNDLEKNDNFFVTNMKKAD